MLEKLKEGLLFEPLTEEEKQKRGILGRLYGPIASFKMGTRNGRLYNESLWEKVFENDIVKELLSMGGIPGEIQHPSDNREETDTTKIAVMMPEAPKKDKQGHLIGYFDIVDTPCGKIAAALAKYGFKFGVSSRGTGDVTTDENGNESVDPDTYTLNAWDLVLIPACSDARMTFQESYNPRNNLKTELFNDINNATEEDQKIMVEALEDLDIDYIPDWASKNEKKTLAENIGNSQSQRLQSLLKENQELKSQVKKLNAKLSVGYAQGSEMQTSLNEAVQQAKASDEKIDALTNENKELKEDFKSLKEVQRKLTEQNRDAKANQSKLNNVSRKLDEALQRNKELSRSIDRVNENLRVAQRTIGSQKAEFEEQLNQKDVRIANLEENLKNDEEIYKNGITKAQKLIEKYKKQSTAAIDGYIKIKAGMIGVTVESVKQQLGESYTFSDIDRICESYVPRIKQKNSLPFNQKLVGIKVSANALEPSQQSDNEEVDIFGFSDW